MLPPRIAVALAMLTHARETLERTTYAARFVGFAVWLRVRDALELEGGG